MGSVQGSKNTVHKSSARRAQKNKGLGEDKDSVQYINLDPNNRLTVEEGGTGAAGSHEVANAAARNKPSAEERKAPTDATEASMMGGSSFMSAGAARAKKKSSTLSSAPPSSGALGSAAAYLPSGFPLKLEITPALIAGATALLMVTLSIVCWSTTRGRKMRRSQKYAISAQEAMPSAAQHTSPPGTRSTLRRLAAGASTRSAYVNSVKTGQFAGSSPQEQARLCEVLYDVYGGEAPDGGINDKAVRASGLTVSDSLQFCWILSCWRGIGKAVADSAVLGFFFLFFLVLSFGCKLTQCPVPQKEIYVSKRDAYVHVVHVSQDGKLLPRGLVATGSVSKRVSASFEERWCRRLWFLLCADARTRVANERIEFVP